MSSIDDWVKAAEEQEISSKMTTMNLKKPEAPAISVNQPATQPAYKPVSQPTYQPASQPASGGDAPAPTESDEKDVPVAETSLLQKLLRSRLVATKADLEVQRNDPNSPLHSVKTFEALNLKPELLKGVYAMGFNFPSKIQESALPALLADPPQNMIAQSQSGTGKTAAFVLAMLSRVDTTKNYTQCMCLSPTYELALQTGEVTKQMAKYMPDIRVGFAVRGERVERNQPVPFHIVIGTPGTIIDWSIKSRVLDLKKLSVLVLDEADVMIATQGHHAQSIRIQKQLSSSCQMLLFSATYDGEVMKFAQAIIPHPIIFRLRREEESLDNIKQVVIHCQDKNDKLRAIGNIYGTISIGQSMIFCHTRATANWLAEKMTAEGNSVALLSGELTVEQRAAVIARFRDGKEKVLITTNVSARGIDIEQVTVVVNFDLPVDMSGKADCETYLHRIGRTGRFGKNGIAINMVDGRRSQRVLDAIREHFGREIESLDAENIDELEKLNAN